VGYGRRVLSSSTEEPPTVDSGPLLLVLLIGLMYVVVVLPRRRQMARQQKMQASLAVGSQVVTIGGIKGEVAGMSDRTLEVQVAPGVVVTFVREAIASVESSPDTDPELGAVDDGDDA
jgi:preprotein translocase subunit YajC